MTKGFWFVAIATAIGTEVEPATDSGSDCGSGGDSDSGGGGGDQSGECNDSLCLGWTEERCGKTSSAVLSLHKKLSGGRKEKEEGINKQSLRRYREVYNGLNLPRAKESNPMTH